MFFCPWIGQRKITVNDFAAGAGAGGGGEAFFTEATAGAGGTAGAGALAAAATGSLGGLFFVLCKTRKMIAPMINNAAVTPLRIYGSKFFFLARPKGAP